MAAGEAKSADEGGIEDEAYEAFEARHIAQLASAAVPAHLWRRVYEKIRDEVFDAGAFFHILSEEDLATGSPRHYSVVALEDINLNDSNSVFLIDHAWTFRPQIARQHLRTIPGLLDRVCAVFDIEEDKEVSEAEVVFGEKGEDEPMPLEGDAPPVLRRREGIGSTSRLKDKAEEPEGSPSPITKAEDEQRINEVLRQMWMHIHTYTVRFTDKEPDESDMPIWYMPDEFGVRIGHSDTPNFRMVPMFYAQQNEAYSLLFPIRDVKAGEVVTRDYGDTLMARQHPEWRAALMHPWIPVDFSGVKLEHVSPDEDFFTASRIMDLLPEARDKAKAVEVAVPKGEKLRIYTDNCQLIERIRTLDYVRASKLEDANVLWMRNHFFDFRGLFERNPLAMVNQFPFEQVFTVKDLLASSIQYAYKEAPFDGETMRWPPAWFQTTFNLNTELPQFIAYYQQREARSRDNTWIVKPWNLARGLDMHVTDNLAYIIRLIESGPKIACKYIHRPLLFRRPDNGHRVKFDLRYIVFVRSLRPLSVFLYNNFWIRFAINDFSLSELDDRETHFTVFNYSNKSTVLNMKCEEFTSSLEKQYPSLKWNEVQKKINGVIREALETVSSGKAPRSMVPNGQSRAMYGVDIMLKWNSDDVEKRGLDVAFIEANFMPDCERACDFYDDFADVVFKTLFMDIVDPNQVTPI